MVQVSEIAPDVFRLSAYNAAANFQFNSFLVRDEEPLLYHTNLCGFFEEIRKAASVVLDPASIRWIGFSHFEADECGSLNDWLRLAPGAAPICSFVGARTSVGDFAIRAPRVLDDGERLETGRHRFRVIETKHVPHGWDASLLFEETGRTLFCSDLFGHNGDVEPLCEGDIIGRTAEYSGRQAHGPMSHSVPYTGRTRPILNGLADLDPATLACMHGSSYSGRAADVLRALGDVIERNSEGV